HSDKKFFEYLILDTFQAGLSWQTIINKRENFRKAFDNFNYKKIAGYGKKDVKRLMQDVGIIRNKLKIKSAVSNAQKFLEIQNEFGSFDKYIWQFVDSKTIKNKFRLLNNIPIYTKEAESMSKDMKDKGFNFVGPTICYAFMQGVGMVNDHTIDCFRYARVGSSKN
ncbi:MAG: DNA-3-methyladenine glycosylase I, partial [Nitrosopumilus sp.]